MPRLIVKPGSEDSWEIELRAGPNLIGRSVSNHFQIRDPSVSGTHCQIFVGDGTAQIKDLGSTNGTFVDQEPVIEAALTPGCSIRLGDVELLFYADRVSPAPAPAAATPASPGIGLPPAVQFLPTAPPDAGVPQLGNLRARQHCRFHPAVPARFTCSQCGHYFCETCVASRGAGAVQKKFCRHCGTECVPVQVQYEAIADKGFFARVPGAFLYPLRGAGVIIVIVGIVLFGMIKGGHALFRFGTLRTIIFGVILEIFAGGYLFSYLQGIVHSSVAEDRELPDLPGIANFAEDVIIPFFRFLGLTLFCFLPAIGTGIWFLSSRAPGAEYVFLGAVAFGYLYFPMAFLAVAVLDAITAGNPLVVMPSIARVPLKYVVSLVPLAAMSAVQWFGSTLLNTLFPEGWTTHAMGELIAMLASIAFISFLSLYLLVVAVHLLGLIFVTSKSELGWLQR
ncbi:MAG TPA: FHA domain-containing protein [Verrucomicrobiae bacterium]